MRTILVPLDGSRMAERALASADRLAAATGATLVLARAVLDRPLPGRNGDRASALTAAESYLERLAEARRPAGIAVDTAVVSGGAADAILEQIRVRDADLVVMTTHGGWGLDRWVFGGVAAEILARSPAPILLVRAWRPVRDTAALARCRSVVVGLDCSDAAEEALPIAEALAGALGGEMVLTRAVEPLRPEEGGDPPAEQTALATRVAEKYLDRLARRFLARGRRVATRASADRAPDAICAVASEQAPCLVVLTSHGYTGASTPLLGSVADEVLRCGEAPLLIVNPEAVLAARVRAEAIGAAPAGPEVCLALDGDEVALLRGALQVFDQTVPAAQRTLHDRVHALLSRLTAELQDAASGSPMGTLRLR